MLEAAARCSSGAVAANWNGVERIRVIVHANAG
jgi:hypothetical protein